MTISLAKLIEIREQNHKLIPLAGKRPIYKEWQNIEATVKQIESWYRKKYSFGLVCDKLCALDFDDIEFGRKWFAIHAPLRCALQLSPRPGVHIILRTIEGVRNAVKVHGCPYDIRGGGNGYIKLYGFIDGYDCLDPEKLDPVKPEWLPKEKSVHNDPVEKSGDMVMRAVHWTAAIPGQKEGYRDNKLFYVACSLIKKFGLSKAEAYPILVSFAARCEPPINNQRVLLRKLDEAMKG